MSSLGGFTTAGQPALELGSAAEISPERDLRTVAGRAGLIAIVLTGALLSLAALKTSTLLPQSIAVVSSLPALAGPLLPLGLHLRAGELLATLAVMFGGWIAVVLCADRLTPRAVILAMAGFLTVVLLAPPLFSTDLFSYQEYARMFFGLHVNPYTHGSQVLALDPLAPYIGDKWIRTPTVYGPLFTLLSGLFANTATTGAIAFSAYAYKTIAALSTVAITAMLWRGARIRGVNPVRAVALFGLNPFVVLYAVGGGHNDLLMLVPATGGILALLSGRERASGALAIVAAAIKLTGGVFLPFALLAEPPAGGRTLRRDVLLGAAVAAVVSIGVGIAVFGTGLVQMFHTLSQVQGEGGWQSIPGFFSTALQWQAASHVISMLFGAVFVVICLRLLWRVRSGELDWIDGAGWATFWLLMATSSILPWYVSWMLVPVALSADRKLAKAALWFSAWVMLSTAIPYIPHGPVILGFQT
ncbi:polyprenol phosphomannose-dependent alpha 1,6 mannosyltransferase MptB [Conexibacter sp. DBS9H8]|uniref:polyprenol phosphomannose-dependent alpha 1,6 mannosyltransferase MptB n=1 Tax=Conexibacter sp. DBS9H8 TaxID=2937801 RepID=UPI002010AA15|nr:polyprenol phosphomannose-dependent alpha 1,6 mannosyltransferase MptB [Conexibacter sp. DBS9H8]